MSKNKIYVITAFVVLFLCLGVVMVNSQTLPGSSNFSTSFSYQGQLVKDGNAVTGLYDLQFALFDAESGGEQVGATWPAEDVTVSDGLFTVLLDFGQDAFNGGPRWLEVSVKPSAEETYTILEPRQLLSPAPYALHAFSIPDGIVTTAKLADSSVTPGKIAPGAVSPSHINTDGATGVMFIRSEYDGIARWGILSYSDIWGMVPTARISDSSIGTSKLANHAVTSAKIASGAVTTDKINNGAVTSAKLADSLIEELAVLVAALLNDNPENQQFEVTALDDSSDIQKEIVALKEANAALQRQLALLQDRVDVLESMLNIKHE